MERELGFARYCCPRNRQHLNRNREIYTALTEVAGTDLFAGAHQHSGHNHFIARRCQDYSMLPV